MTDVKKVVDITNGIADLCKEKICEALDIKWESVVIAGFDSKNNFIYHYFASMKDLSLISDVLKNKVINQEITERLGDNNDGC
jgi:hypothetical protein